MHTKTFQSWSIHIWALLQSSLFCFVKKQKKNFITKENPLFPSKLTRFLLEDQAANLY
jgi:hypothetical protein